MTDTDTDTTERQVFRQLARIHIKRYLRHPLFLVGSGLMVVTAFSEDPLWFYTSFFIGIFAIIIAYRLTRTEEKALDLLPAAPTSTVTRALALCAASVVPALAGTVGLILFWVSMPADYIEPGGGPGGIAFLTPGQRLAFLVGVTTVAGLGGALLGVAVGRWWRFRGAGILATVLVFGGVIALGAWGDTAQTIPQPMSARIANTLTLWTSWGVVPADGVQVKAEGSPYGHLIYLLGLCALAAWAAVIKNATGEERRVWNRRGVIFALVTVGGFLWALFG